MDEDGAKWIIASVGLLIILALTLNYAKTDHFDYATQIKGMFPHFEYCYNGQPSGEYASVWCAVTSKEADGNKTVLMRNFCFATDNQDGKKTIWCKPDDNAVFQKIKIA